MNNDKAGKEMVADADLQLILFKVSGERYTIDVMKSKEIIKPLKITPLPDVPPFIKGVINLRGALIPVVSMSERFGASVEKAETAGTETRIIIVALKKMAIGILVDSVDEIIRVPLKDIQPPPRIAEGIDSKYMKGICRMEDDALVLLDLDKILSSAKKVMIEGLKGSISKKKKKAD
ncbi:MAG: chemotaxis protein CheW [Deltaproteobacteria bacterium]|nr:chemotaxis protein CheW [Deltaproteobacteria bacterium]